MPDRIHGERIRIDDDQVQRFFSDRARRGEKLDPVVAMLYQDSNPALAMSRDLHEKETVLPLLKATDQDRVLDIGCGLGRWTDVLADQVAVYVGTDPIEPLIDMARQRSTGRKNVSFHVCGAEQISLDRLSQSSGFTTILIAGVLHYLNDDVCEAAFRNALACAAETSRVLVRTPIGIEGRFTLRGIWSEELGHKYSAIYRSRAEYLEIFDTIFLGAGFRLTEDFALYTDALSNRTETRQHIFLLERQ
jgi:SAM-dependent methyltransferase